MSSRDTAQPSRLPAPVRRWPRSSRIWIVACERTPARSARSIALGASWSSTLPFTSSWRSISPSTWSEDSSWSVPAAFGLNQASSCLLLPHRQLHRPRRRLVLRRVVLVRHGRWRLRLDRVFRLERVFERLDVARLDVAEVERRLAGGDGELLDLLGAHHLGEVAGIDGETGWDAEVEDDHVGRHFAVITEGRFGAEEVGSR